MGRLHVEERTQFDIFLELLTAADELSTLRVGAFFTVIMPTFDLLWAGGCMMRGLIHVLLANDKTEQAVGKVIQNNTVLPFQGALLQR